VSNSKNINSTKEANFIEIVLSLWKFKNNFLYIFIPLLLASLLLESTIKKKSILEIKLKDPIIINSEILKTYDGKDILLPQESYFILYYNNFFEPIFLSKKSLEDFSKANNEKYKLFDYIVKNQIFVKKKQNIYELILPKNDLNQSFFKEYLNYTATITLRKFEDEIAAQQHRKIKNIEKSLANGEEIFKNDMEANEMNEMTKNEYYQFKFKFNLEKKKQIEEMLFFKNNKFFYDENWIDHIHELKKNQNYLIFSKFALPLVLSFVLYLWFVLIKLKTQDQQN
jgi:hypothetical protein